MHEQRVVAAPLSGALQLLLSRTQHRVDAVSAESGQALVRTVADVGVCLHEDCTAGELVQSAVRSGIALRSFPTAADELLALPEIVRSAAAAVAASHVPDVRAPWHEPADVAVLLPSSAAAARAARVLAADGSLRVLQAPSSTLLSSDPAVFALRNWLTVLSNPHDSGCALAAPAKVCASPL